MTLDSGAYKAIEAAAPDAFVALGPGAACVPHPNTAAIVDITAALEPSARALGTLSKRDQAALAAQLGRALTPADYETTPQTWREWALDHSRHVRALLGEPNVALVAIAADRATPPAKFLEHADRYGSDVPGTGKATAPGRAAARRASAQAQTPAAAAPAPAPAPAPPKPPPASDDEVAAALAAPTIPRDWARYRGNRRFVDALTTHVIDAVCEAQAATLGGPSTAPTPPSLIVVGDPRRGRDSHRPVLHHVAPAAPAQDPCAALLGAAQPGGVAAGDGATAAGDDDDNNNDADADADADPMPCCRGAASGPPQRRTYVLDDAELCLDYFEADFAVVHLASVLTRRGMHALVRACDGDTLLALLLETPRRFRAHGADNNAAPAARPPACHMLRDVAGKATLIDVDALHAALRGPAAAALLGDVGGGAGFNQRGARSAPVASVVVSALLHGNDYALKLMPEIGDVRLRETLRAHAAELAALVTATPDAALAADVRAQHTVRVDRALLHRLVAAVYARFPAVAAYQPPAAYVDLAHAVLECTLSYFANAANPWAPPLDIFARCPATNLSLHGYELIDATKPPSRHNVRNAARVAPRAPA